MALTFFLGRLLHKNYSTIFFSVTLLICCSAYAQKYKSCEVANDSGASIEGFYKNYNSFSVLGNGFKLYNEDKKKIKITPEYWHTVQIDTVTYHAIVNSEGKNRFMKLLEEGPNAILYLDTVKMTANVPGEGLSMWLNHTYYLLKKGHYYPMPENKLLNQPEFFFPEVKKLCAAIKKAGKENITWRKWVEDYNKLTLTETVE